MTGIPFLSAAWRHLAMVNYEVKPTLLEPFVPSGTKLDAWNRRVYVSIVGFMFLGTKVRGWPVPFHADFEEVNLRFYVRRRVQEDWRRGVVFIKEIVPRRAIATVARLAYAENYVAMPMRHRAPRDGVELKAGNTVEYQWRFNRKWNQLATRVVGEPRFAQPGSEEEFITEHYWGYSAQPDGTTKEYRVEHPRWRIWPVGESLLACDVERLYGRAFIECLSSPATSAFLAEGSPVKVYSPATCRSE